MEGKASHTGQDRRRLLRFPAVASTVLHTLALIVTLALVGLAATIAEADDSPEATGGGIGASVQRIFSERERRAIEDFLEERRRERDEDRRREYEQRSSGPSYGGPTYGGVPYTGDRKHNGEGPGKGKGKGPKGLPPGMQNRLAMGKPLPPGIAARDLPPELERNLPPVREGYERVMAAGRVILRETATGVIRDIIGGPDQP